MREGLTPQGLDPRLSLAGLQLCLFTEGPGDLDVRQTRQEVQRVLDAHEQQETQALRARREAGRRRRAAAERGDESGDIDPELNLDDEDLVYFQLIGRRTLLAEMVIQSVRDLALLQDQARCERLKRKDPEGFEEIEASARWLSTVNGRLAVHLVFPDWDHDLIVQKILADPVGVLQRFESWTRHGTSSRPCEADGAPMGEASVSLDLSDLVDALESEGAGDVFRG